MVDEIPAGPTAAEFLSDLFSAPAPADRSPPRTLMESAAQLFEAFPESDVPEPVPLTTVAEADDDSPGEATG